MMESTPKFGQTEMFRLRHSLVALIEELKLRKKYDADNGAKIQELVSKNHALQKAKELEMQKARQKEESFQRSMEELKQQYEDKFRGLNIDQRQQEFKSEARDFVGDKVKDEMRQLQMSIYEQEKTIQELETKLQSQESSSEKILAQFVGVEHKLSSLTQSYHSTQQSVNRLEGDGEYHLVLWYPFCRERLLQKLSLQITSSVLSHSEIYI